MTSTLVLVLGAALLLAVLTSALSARSPLSTSTVFLAVGLLTGPLALGLVEVEGRTVERAAEVALFAILFTDGQHAPWPVLRDHGAGAARALVGAMPLTFLVVAALGHWAAGLTWPAALVLGAVLAPTDPVFASALVGREDVPRGLRHVLNIESGLNDGLALPAVLLLVSAAGGHPAGWSTDPGVLLAEVGVGALLGLVLPLVVTLVLRLPGVGADEPLLPLGPLAVALLLYGGCEMAGANQFIAAFVAGATIATVRPAASDAFRRTGELVSELAKGAALLAFATLVDTSVLATAGLAGLVVAAGVLLLSRPLPVLAVMAGSSLPGPERLALAWFGPKGFASVAYAVIVALSQVPQAEEVLALVAVTVLVSVLAHSSTDVVVARWLTRRGAGLAAGPTVGPTVGPAAGGGPRDG